MVSLLDMTVMSRIHKQMLYKLTKANSDTNPMAHISEHSKLQGSTAPKVFKKS